MTARTWLPWSCASPNEKSRYFPVWGRFCYVADVGRPQDGSVSGSLVIIEASSRQLTWKHSKSASPAEAAELDRLEADGHVLTRTRSCIEITSSVDAVRATQLYRTLPHEIGHLVHFDEREDFWDLSSQEKESFAHRYADEFRARMQAEGKIPFPRIESWKEDGLRLSDFVLSE